MSRTLVALFLLALCLTDAFVRNSKVSKKNDSKRSNQKKAVATRNVVQEEVLEEVNIPAVTNANLQDLMQQHPILMVVFCADNAQCNDLKENAWPAAARQLKGDVTLGWADCDTAADLCTRFSITKKPTSYLLRDGKMFGYTGDFSAADIVKSMKLAVDATSPSALNKNTGSAAATTKSAAPQKEMTPAEMWAYGLMAGLQQAFGVKPTMEKKDAKSASIGFTASSASETVSLSSTSSKSKKSAPASPTSSPAQRKQRKKSVNKKK